jgi:hypothetical protein
MAVIIWDMSSSTTRHDWPVSIPTPYTVRNVAEILTQKPTIIMEVFHLLHNLSVSTENSVGTVGHRTQIRESESVNYSKDQSVVLSLE